MERHGWIQDTFAVESRGESSTKIFTENFSFELLGGMDRGTIYQDGEKTRKD